MQIFKTKNKILLFFFLLFCSGAYAQETVADKTAHSTQNPALILMIIVMLILAFVILGMGRVLVLTGRQILDKKKNADKLLMFFLLAGCLISKPSFAQELTTEKTAASYAGISPSSFWVIVTVLIIEVAVIAFFMFSIRRLMAELLPPQEKKKYAALKSWWTAVDKKFFTKAVPIEKEADVLLDHDYDGIRELDNSLPPWWKYGFIFTIGVAAVYMLHFHVFGSGKNPTEEYNEEMAKAVISKEIYEAANKDRVDENNIKMPNASGLAEAKDIFTSVCSACHGKLGEGGAGPNLTDEYWLHKGSLTNVYFSVKNGYPDKGMQAWEKNYSPKQINNLAGYIKTLGGSHPPNAKAAQGDLFNEIPSDSNRVAQK